MNGIRLTLIAGIMLLAGGIHSASAQCLIPQQAPTMRVEINASEPLIDHNRPRQSLKQFEIASVSPYGRGQMVHVNGLMRGAISLETQTSVAWQRQENGEENCFWFNEVNVQMKLSPTIYIAREIIKDSCLYQEVLKHEYKHYQVDLSIAQEYQLIFQQELGRFLAQNNLIGPFSSQLKDQPKQQLMKNLETVMHAVNERLKVERIQRQAVVDTREEYERVANACPSDKGMM